MEPKYTAQNILAGWDELQERNKKRRRLPTILNELYALSDPNFRNSGAYAKNRNYIAGLGEADFTDYSRRMNMLAQAEQEELDTLFMGRMADANLNSVEDFDAWVANQGSYVAGKRNKFFDMWDKRMDTMREQEKYYTEKALAESTAASKDRVSSSVFGTMSNHRAGVVGSDSGTVVNRIEEAVADIYADETLTEQEKLDAASSVYERMGKVANLNKTQREELRKIEDREVAARNRALSSGRTIIRNQLVEEGIDRIKAGEDFQTVKEDIMLKANRDIMDKDIIASVRSGLEFAKKPDARSTQSKNFDEVMALLGPSDNRAFNINKVIQMEVDSANTNPLFYEYAMPRKEAQAIEQAFYKLKMADPDVIDEQAFRQEFSEFAQTATNEQVEAALQRAEQQLGIPKRMLLYIIYGRKGYQDLVEGN
jgi:hypothetical protein